MGNYLPCQYQYGQPSEERLLEKAVALWDTIEPYQTRVGELVYEYMFEEYPESKQMFSDKTLSRMPHILMNMIQSTIRCGSIDKMLLKLCAVGKIHAEHNVPEEAFDHFLQALVKAMEQVCSEENLIITEEEIEQFSTIYHLMSHAILQHMYTCNVILETKSRVPEFQPEKVKGDGLTLHQSLIIFQDFWTQKVVKKKHKAAIGKRFYRLLFTYHPEYRQMFPTYMDVQEQLLVNMIEMFTVEGIEKFGQRYDKLIKTHAKFGLTRKHFQYFGQTLILAIKDTISSEFTSAEVHAFRIIFNLMSSPMIIGIENKTLNITWGKGKGPGPRNTPRYTRIPNTKSHGARRLPKSSFVLNVDKD